MLNLKEKPDKVSFNEPDIDDIVYAVANGAYTIPLDKEAPIHDYRALLKYCEEKNTDPAELSNEDLKQFEIKKKTN